MGKRDLKVVLLGSAGSGKTALAVMFGRKYFPKAYDPTVFTDFHTREVNMIKRNKEIKKGRKKY